MSPVTLVMLPGMDGTAELFRLLIEHLPSELQTVRVRFPHLARYDELLPIVAESQPTSRFVLLAESFSGPLAVMAAARNPRGLIAVILCASFVRSRMPLAHRLRVDLLGSLAFRFTPKALRDRILLGPDSSLALRRGVDDAVGSVPPDILAARLRQIFQTDVRAELRRCAVPFLYLRAKQDRLIGQRSAAEIVAIQPATRVERLDGPHLLLQARPSESAAAITRFLAGLNENSEVPRGEVCN